MMSPGNKPTWPRSAAEIVVCLLAALAAVSLVCLLSSVPEALGQEVASLYSAQGNVEASGTSGENWQAAQVGTGFKARDSLRTAKNSRAGVLFSDGVLVRLKEESILQFKEDPSASKGWLVKFHAGTGYFFNRGKKELPTIETQSVSAAVRGTEFVIEASSKRTVISVLDGEVECSNAHGSVRVQSGEQAVTDRGKAPVKSILIKPLDAVQWALYYPAVLDFADYGAALGAKSKDAFSRSLSAYRQGDIAKALGEIESANDSDSKIRLYKASLNLSVGQISEAQELLDQVGSSAQMADAALSSAYYTQRAIISLVKNDKDTARTDLTTALERDGQSAAAALAMSYVEQASFQLPEARHWITRAAQAAPQSATIRARLAEIELGFGQTREALKSAEKALELGPDDSYALTVMGFVQLTLSEPQKARKYFTRALALDPSFGLTYLGHGLALIREGDLTRGRTALEQAVHTEPNISLYRSYLGKAYFEEDRGETASLEYRRAMVLDPLDPTPHLYQAYQHMAVNEPVQALSEVEESIALNGNRAVYRSKLLLDQDLGVKSSTLSQVFSRLGFNDLARAEAIRSINHDYSNPSAHLLLGESNRELGLEQASLAETLIGRLLLPVNYNAILPSSSSDASFNEYTALFDRPAERWQFEAAGLTKVDRVRGGLAYVHNFGRYGLGIEVTEELENGRQDDEQDKFTTVNGSLRWQMAPEENFIVDTEFQSDEDEFSDSAESTEVNLNDFALGYHHRFGPQSHFVAQARYSESGREASDKTFDIDRVVEVFADAADGEPIQHEVVSATGEIDEEFSGGRFDAQFIHDTELVSFVLGGGALDADVERDEASVALSSNPEGLRMIAAPPPGEGPLPGGPGEGSGGGAGGGSGGGGSGGRPDEDRPDDGPPSLEPPPEMEHPPGPAEPLDLTGLSLISEGDAKEASQRAYLYSTWHMGQWADIDVGGSLTRLELTRGSGDTPFVDGTIVKEKFLPKFGVTLYPDRFTTVHSAYFKTAGVAGVTDVTRLEPSLVGGTNQIYDEFPGSIAEGASFGADYKIPNFAYFGSEYLAREFTENRPGVITVLLAQEPGSDPVQDDFNVISLVREVEEDRVRSYWYQVLGQGTTATVEHVWIDTGTDFSRPDPATRDQELEVVNSSDVETHRVRLGLNHFWPGGWYTFGAATWRHQRASGLDEMLDGLHDFWVVDAGLGFQLANRHGAVELKVQNLLDQDFKYSLTSDETFLLNDLALGLAARYNF